MNASPTPKIATAAANLRAVAGSLESIADAVRTDAAAATEVVRQLEDTAGETALLATALATAAAQIEHAVAAQAALLRDVARNTGDSLAMVEALAQAGQGIDSMSATIGAIAGRGRMLALNARIEAARAGAVGRGFDVVAHEMGALAQSTLAATRDIEDRTGTIERGVTATRTAFEGVNSAVENERRLIGDIVAAIEEQKGIAAEVARLTDTTRAEISSSAEAIGRVSTSAAAVGVLARQVKRTAAALEAAASD
ncbi:methyl-accepting chemotaxis protein [Sphingomonas donggukensis]|uniref:Methyl-accepting chemotaxis protein n=1 Tax=Sphingomonas donggukensis TaxID=2949093 RepID=A0ABY4TTP6_9SPHN|nr:methyl-accepting chemotaxis protein [Sphingomonas donggukensis]URW75773.1 methyl-accepting chemotaxis protein [Sphingomonas donggukensis]